MTFTDAVRFYLDDCRTDKSATTIDSYARTLRFFGDFLERNSVTDLSGITTALIAQWKLERAEGTSVTSLNTYLTHIRIFFTFCVEMDLLEKNPYKKVLDINKNTVRRASEKPYEKIIDESQFRVILSNRHPKGAHKACYARNRAILALLLTSGIRVSSLCAITPAHLDWERGTIYLPYAKGGKNGDVAFTEVAQVCVRAYLESGYRPDDCTEDMPLFGANDTENTWKAYSRQNMSRVVEAAVRGFLGLSGYRSHAMRHSMATMLHKRGMKDEEIGVLLMHSDGTGPAVTGKYIERDNTRYYQKANDVFKRIVTVQ